MVEEGLVGALTALSGIDDETLEFFAEGVCNVAQYECGRTEVGKGVYYERFYHWLK